MKQHGFTLIELIIYIALVSLFIGGAILFSWDVIFGRVKSTVQQEVTQNLRLASHRITYEIRNARGVNELTATSLNLSHQDPALDPTVIDLSSDRIRIGQGGAGSCPTTDPCFLTSNLVRVQRLNFADLSSGDPASGNNTDNIQFTLSINAAGERQEWGKNQTYRSTVEVRSR